MGLNIWEYLLQRPLVNGTNLHLQNTLCFATGRCLCLLSLWGWEESSSRMIIVALSLNFSMPRLLCPDFSLKSYSIALINSLLTATALLLCCAFWINSLLERPSRSCLQHLYCTACGESLTCRDETQEAARQKTAQQPYSIGIHQSDASTQTIHCKYTRNSCCFREQVISQAAHLIKLLLAACSSMFWWLFVPIQASILLCIVLHILRHLEACDAD